MARELPKVYEPQQVETQIYKMWEENGYFAPSGKKDAKPFTIVMPPPNVTGQLHMGHAMDATLQDTLIRFKRMQATIPCGSPVLTMPASPPRSRWKRNSVLRKA